MVAVVVDVIEIATDLSQIVYANVINCCRSYFGNFYIGKLAMKKNKSDGFKSVSELRNYVLSEALESLRFHISYISLISCFNN